MKVVLKKIITSFIVIMMLANYIPVGMKRVKALELDEEGVVIDNKYETVEDYLEKHRYQIVEDENGEIIEIELFCFSNDGQIKDLTGLYKYPNLTKLTLVCIRNLDIDFTKFPKLKTLEIKFSNIINSKEMLEKTINLEKLYIENTAFLKSEGKLDISKMNNLKELFLDKLYIDRVEYEPIKIIGTEKLIELEKLNLCDVILEKELDLSSFEKLKEVNIDCIEEETYDYDADNEAQLNELAEKVRDRMVYREEEFAVIILYTYRRKKPWEISQVWEWILERACSDEFYQNSDHGDYLENSLLEGSMCKWSSLGKEAVENQRERYLLSLKYNLKYDSTKEEEDRIWISRRSSFGATAKLAPNVLTEDVVVPRENIVALVKGIQEICDKYQIKTCIMGHIGDGNIHPNMALDLRNAEERLNFERAKKELFELALSLNGTLSGEHGIGCEKSEFINRAIDSNNLKMMKQIKKLFDSKNILNPDKIF